MSLGNGNLEQILELELPSDTHATDPTPNVCIGIIHIHTGEVTVAVVTTCEQN